MFFYILFIVTCILEACLSIESFSIPCICNLIVYAARNHKKQKQSAKLAEAAAAE